MMATDLKPLTGLRGLAALTVTAYHLLLPGHLLTGLAARMLARGYLAVDLFFMLSGFVLALNHGADFTAPHRVAALRRFLWRRWLRIYPLYGLILVAALGYTAWRYGGFALPRPWIAVPLARPWPDIAANLLLVQAWGVGGSIIGPAWSVSTEWGAYLAFPLLCIAILHRRPAAALAAAAGGAALVLAAALRHGGLDCWDGRTPAPLMRCLGGFTIGMALWRLATWPPARRLAGHPAGCVCIAASLAALAAAQAPDLVIYPVLAALILAAACAPPGASRLLAGSIALWLGEVSYALYLLHIFLLHPLDLARAAAALVLPPAAADALAACLILSVLLAAAELAHSLIERPIRRRAAPRHTSWRHASAARRSSLTRPTPNPRNLPLPAPLATLRPPDTITLRTAR